MTHEQLAKKYLEKIHLHVFGYFNSESSKEIDDFFRHLKEAVKKDMEKGNV